MNKHGNTGNKNAAKENAATSHLHIRVTPRQKASFVRALKDNEKLSEFVINACEKELNKRGKTNENI